MNQVEQVARDVIRIPVKIGNCYLVGDDADWVLVDSGTEGNADRIRRIASQEFGIASRPRAIVLTHGHFDHAGSAMTLSDAWGVAIYAHRLELPYLTGKSKYPPPDPTVGGFMAQMIRFFPNKAFDLGDRVREFPGAAESFGMRGWRIVETPGHSPGHVSFYRESDSVLLAGDAFATVDQTSAYKMMTRKPEVTLPPTYYTCDWELAHHSVEVLADLGPQVLAAGHGEPMSGPEALEGVRCLAREWPAPKRGRYVQHPAVTDENGVVYTPPPARDPMKWVGLGVVAAGGIGTAVYWKGKKRAA
jgi:glyoxylase-like metal-dependent hydrolase (beta-lactamase superfamily II)